MSGEAPSTLQVNLVALDRVDPILGQRLRWSMAGDHVVRQDDGRVAFTSEGHSVSLHFPAEALVQRLFARTPPSRVLILGVGLGESVETALNFWPDTVVEAWDRDPWMMRLLLARRDFTRALLTRRLQLRVGPDLLDVDRSRADKVVEHPVLAPHYRKELRAWQEAEPRRLALMCTRGLFVGDVARELENRGYLPWRVEVERIDFAEFEHTVRRLRPLLGVAINQVVGLPEAMDALGVPLITWEIDPAVDWLPRPSRPVPHSYLFTFRRRNANALADAPHGTVRWLPLAAPDHRRPVEPTAEERQEYGVPVSFVGSSLAPRARQYAQSVLGDIRQWLAAHGQPPNTAGQRLGKVLDGQRQEPDVWRLPELLEAHCPGFREWCRSTGKPSDPAMMLGELPAAEHRLRVVGSLAPFGMHVWGDPGWNRLRGQKVRVRGYAGHHRALTRIYSLSTINIDIGRLYQPDIVTMRVFDVMACGGFVLAAHSEELEQLFDVGREVVSWSSREELVEKVRYFLAHPEEARELAERGQAAVLARHRVDQRVTTMLEHAGLADPQSE